MKKIYFILALLFLNLTACFAQAQNESAWGIKFSGFVNTEFTYDTRQTVNSREGMFLLFPANVLRDSLNNDINDKSNFNLMSFKSRLAGKIKMPDVLGAKTSGLIEAEFFGSTDATINTLRLRHAYVQMDWSQTSLLMGQYWHPMFVSDVYPTTISFNTGAPFQPFIRSPQVRLTQNLGESFKVIAAACAQRDFSSPGPSGNSYIYMSNSLVPDLNLHFQFRPNNGNLVGFGGNYKSIMPRLSTVKGYKTDEKISGMSAMGYMKLTFEPVTFKLEGVYGNNLPEMQMLGGYIVNTRDSLTGRETYSNIGCYSVWGELSAGKDIEYGVFAGYTKNTGSEGTPGAIPANYKREIFGRGTDIDNILRVSPRISYTTGSLKLAAEVEYTSAAYGTISYTDKYQVKDPKRVNNTRFLFDIFYYY